VTEQSRVNEFKIITTNANDQQDRFVVHFNTQTKEVTILNVETIEETTEETVEVQ
jgi:hypothetical protein